MTRFERWMLMVCFGATLGHILGFLLGKIV